MVKSNNLLDRWDKNSIFFSQFLVFRKLHTKQFVLVVRIVQFEFVDIDKAHRLQRHLLKNNQTINENIEYTVNFKVCLPYSEADNSEGFWKNKLKTVFSHPFQNFQLRKWPNLRFVLIETVLKSENIFTTRSIPMFVFASAIDYTPGAWIVSMKIYAYWILRKTKSFLSTSVGVCVCFFYMITHFILFSRRGLQCLNCKSESVLVLCLLQSKCPFACWL